MSAYLTCGLCFPLCVVQEIVMLLWILLELCLRVWSAGCRSRYQGKTGRLRFVRRPLCIIGKCLCLCHLLFCMRSECRRGKGERGQIFHSLFDHWLICYCTGARELSLCRAFLQHHINMFCFCHPDFFIHLNHLCPSFASVYLLPCRDQKKPYDRRLR